MDAKDSIPVPVINETPKAEVAIDSDLVRRLLSEQHPDLAELPISLLDSGWDNTMFRLGEEYTVRLPRRQIAASLMENEQKWLPRIAERLPIPISCHRRLGIPASYYPWNWSVLPWFPGLSADKADIHRDQARPIGAFLRALHTPAPPEAPTNAVRGVPLKQRAEVLELRIERVSRATTLITPDIVRAWSDAKDLPIDTGPMWLHGDLHPQNILVENGAVTAIIDWGDITAGDVATDLAAVWMLFDDPVIRESAFLEYGLPTTLTLQRAKAWAVLFGVMLVDTGLKNNPRHAALGARILRNVSGENRS